MRHYMAVAWAVIMSAAASSFAADGASGPHPRLLFRAADLPAIKQAAKTPEGMLIVARLESALKADPEKLGAGAGFYAAAHGIAYQLSGDKSHAQKAAEVVQAIIEDKITHYGKKTWVGNYKWIIRAPQVEGVAYAYDLCYDAWPADFREKVAAELDKKAGEMAAGGGDGWNGSSQSNWNPITRGSGGVAALAVLGDKGASNAEKNLERCGKLVMEWVSDVDSNGEAGEGEGYMEYALCHGVLPFADAYYQAKNEHFLPEKVRDALATNYLQKCVLFKDKIWWANYGPYDIEIKTGFYRNGTWLYLVDLAPDKIKPAMVWAYAKRFGMEGDKTFDVNVRNDGEQPGSNPQLAGIALRVLAGKPKAADPATLVSRNSEGEAFGHYLMRSGWKDSGDLLASIWFKARPIKAWNYLDAGSFRIFGLGTAWAAKLLPTSNDGRGDRKWSEENVVIVPGMKGEGKNEASEGKRVSWTARKDGGGIASGDLSAIYGMKHVRSFAVDYSGVAGVPGLYAVADSFENAVDGAWQMHTRAEKAQVNGNTFVLTGAGGATMIGTVVLPADAKLSTDGKTIKLEGNAKCYFVVMTLQAKGVGPKPAAKGNVVTVGGQTITLQDDGTLVLAK